MELDFAFLADSAQILGGKLYAMGGATDRLWAQKVPVAHPRMSLVLRFELSAAEVDRAHQLEVIMMDSDGKRVAGVSGQLKVGRRPDAESWKPATPLLALDLVNVRFEKFGVYSIEVMVNGSSLKSLPLELLERQPPPESGPAAGDIPDAI